MPVEISLPTALPWFDVQAELDGVTYTLECRWNVRLGAWFLRVLDDQGVAVLLGDQRLVADYPLALAITSRSPSGLLAALDTSGQGLDPGFTDLGGRVKLVYVTTAELA